MSAPYVTRIGRLLSQLEFHRDREGAWTIEGQNVRMLIHPRGCYWRCSGPLGEAARPTFVDLLEWIAHRKEIRGGDK